MRHVVMLMVGCAMLVGCAANQPQEAADLNAAFNVAAAAEAAYAAQPGADPKLAAEMAKLLETAQAALQTWTATPSPTTQTAINAAIAALVAYEASAKAS